jgi:enoyl-CoA hydratase/carnithine racemase
MAGSFVSRAARPFSGDKRGTARQSAAMFELSSQGGIARLHLSRPERRNAIPLAGWAELADRAGEAATAGARVLILAGVPGGAFCAGADVSDFHVFHEDPAARTAFRLAIRDGLDRLRALPIPTIAAVEGACYGAGVAVAMACDIRLATVDARFAITPAKLGIGYPQEDVHRLVTLVGLAQAARLLFTAAPIDGHEAARIGLTEQVIETGLETELNAMAQITAGNSSASLLMLKRGLGLAARGVASDDAQDEAFDDLLGSDELAEKLAAHRRRPN